jgi:hypothetical protein
MDLRRKQDISMRPHIQAFLPALLACTAADTACTGLVGA